ncbi:hypothetical protein CLOHYLEM_05480 [[Clostridium] hylemonae DSM 15053]|uniref:Uncharacterized protein n=1 Tax=[Clostridium] hylemonae DSM 15053 TaxID=553973 RepID=C0C086_9FIRM|nr:hypothetical protein CLOHYLEM_05480 [[Clostridium] hylemonae DSM 15053]
MNCRKGPGRGSHACDSRLFFYFGQISQAASCVLTKGKSIKV